MRQPVTVYLPDDLHERLKREAVKQGVSLSTYLTRQLSSAPSRIEELQHWIALRLDRIDAALGNGGAAR